MRDVSAASMPWHHPAMATIRHGDAAGPVPDAAGLHDAALDYLARYAATEAALRRVLERRIERWSRRAAEAGDADMIAGQAAAARTIAHDIVARLVAAGAVNDAAYAANRVRSMARAGRSRLAAAAHLAARGIDPATTRTALAEDESSELAAALVLARRRRIGPFRRAAVIDDAGRRRELGVLARAGFPQAIAQQALAMDIAQADALVTGLRR